MLLESIFNLELFKNLVVGLNLIVNMIKLILNCVLLLKLRVSELLFLFRLVKV